MNEDEDIGAKAYALVSQQIAAWKDDGNDEEMYSDDLDFDEFEDEYNEEDMEDDLDRESMDHLHISPDPKSALRRRSSSGAYSRDGSSSIRSLDGSSIDANDLTYSPFKSTTIFHPFSSENQSDSNSHAIFLDYYETLFSFLERKQSISTQTDLANNLSENDNDSQMNITDRIKQENIQIDLDYFQSFSKICQRKVKDSTSSSPDLSMTRQMQLWKLLHLLRKHEGQNLANDQYDDDDDDNHFNEKSSAFLLPSHHPTNYSFSTSSIVTSADLHSSPPQILQKLLQTNVMFQRRYLLLQWISSSLFQHRTIHLPPRSRSTMWPVALSMQQDMDPDAPLRTNNVSLLPGTDESDEIDFLKALLRLYQSNQIQSAIQLCNEVGQPWRAATFTGGLPTQHFTSTVEDDSAKDSSSTKEQGKEEEQKNDFDSLNKEWNPNYFLWKQQCSKLAQQTLEFAKQTKSREPPSLLYESALYSIFSCDLDSSLSNPLMRTWEDGVYLHFHTLVHRMIDEVLIQHCNIQRTVGKRFPFKGYASSKKVESALMERTSKYSKITEESIFDSLSTSSHESVQKEGMDTLRVLTSCFIIGKEAVIKFIQDYVSDLNNLEKEQTDPMVAPSASSYSSGELLQYLPFIVHLVVYMENLLQSLPMTQALQVLLLKFMQIHLYPTPSLWKCIALYTSLISDESIQVEEYKEFLKQVKLPGLRRNMIEQARSFLPSGMDLNIIKLLLDETFVSLDSEEMKKINDDDIKRKMDMIQWALFYREHRFDAVWYANILLRQFLLQMKYADSKCLCFAQKFLESHFPRDSINVVHNFYNNGDAITDMDEVEVEQIMTGIHHVTEEHEGLCLFVDANTLYESWRSSLARCTNDIKQVFSATSIPSYLQNDKKHKLNATELEIAEQMQQKERYRKVKSVSQKLIEAAYETEILLKKILKYPGGWLVRPNMEDENHQEELDELRKICLPRTVALWVKLCIDMGDWMESILLETNGRSLFEGEEDDEIHRPQYWYRTSLSIATIVARDEYQISQTFSNDEMKDFLDKMKEVGLKLLKVEYIEGKETRLTLD